MGRGSLVLSSCRFVVLDEADEMLDLGFLEDVETILKNTPNGRQTALFSATMPPPIRELADRYLYHPEVIKVKSQFLTVDTVEQFRLETKSNEKADTLVDVLAAERPDQAIVFTRTKIRADQLFRKLRDKGMNVKALHGDLSQGQRDGVMLSFKGGRVPILVATDVAARGLDISIGRTGRIGRSGRAITFVEPRQKKELAAIEKHIGQEISPWEAGAHTKPAPVEERPRRHSKPHLSRNGDEPYAKLIASSGRADGVEVSDIVHAVTHEAGVDGEAVRDVKVLEHFSVLSVPASEAERIVDAVRSVRLAPARL
jgi:ATP-dependent RNA helicase DeaD